MMVVTNTFVFTFGIIFILPAAILWSTVAQIRIGDWLADRQSSSGMIGLVTLATSALPPALLGAMLIFCSVSF